MTPTQKLEFVELATAHGYRHAVRLLRDKHGAEVFAGSADPLRSGDRSAKSTEAQRQSADALRHLYRRTG